MESILERPAFRLVPGPNCPDDMRDKIQVELDRVTDETRQNPEFQALMDEHWGRAVTGFLVGG